MTEIVPYKLTPQVPRQASWDATVRFDRSRYSISARTRRQARSG
jgi:hypothetical protein